MHSVRGSTIAKVTWRLARWSYHRLVGSPPCPSCWKIGQAKSGLTSWVGALPKGLPHCQVGLLLEVSNCNFRQAKVPLGESPSSLGEPQRAAALKSTYFSSLFGMVEIPDDPSATIAACSDVPLATTGDEMRVDVAAAEYEAQTNEEHICVHEDVVFDDLAYLEVDMVDLTMQASLRDFSSGASISEISSTDAQPESVLIDVTPSIDAHTDGATDMQTSPQA
uniref:Polyprotein protein n=1 Tax=Solanum tuberosum TaxID=4113 RepID=M1DBJ5_SOLTU